MTDQRPWRRGLRIAGGVLVAVVMAAPARDLAGGSSRPTLRATGRDPSTPSPSAPSGSRDPSTPLLSGLIVSDADVAPALTVAGLQGGNELTQPTLDLCNGTFPSEGMRTARLQVAAIDRQGATVLSTEAGPYSPRAGAPPPLHQTKAGRPPPPPRPGRKPRRR